jgi:hypothetical protein
MVWIATFVDRSRYRPVPARTGPGTSTYSACRSSAHAAAARMRLFACHHPRHHPCPHPRHHPHPWSDPPRCRSVSLCRSVALCRSVSLCLCVSVFLFLSLSILSRLRRGTLAARLSRLPRRLLQISHISHIRSAPPSPSRSERDRSEIGARSERTDLAATLSNTAC